MHFPLYCCGLVALLTIAANQVAADSCHLREVDLCVAIGMFHYQSNGVPGDEDKLNEWCETMQEVKDCMGNYTSKCLSPLQRELMQLLSGAEDIGNQFCTDGSEVRTSFLAHSECLADGAESQEFKVQMKDMQVIIETLFDIPFKQRFPLICCGVNRYHDKVEELTKAKCGEESVMMLRNMMKMIFTDLPEIICQQYDYKGEQCTNLLPPSGTPSKGAENKSQLGKLLDTVFGSL